MDALSKKFGGEAAKSAETTQGKFKRLKVSLDETKESIGEGMLPVIEAVLPFLQKFADWASKNPETFKVIALAIGAVALAILAVNAAMALNPFSLIAAGIALLVVGLATAYQKFEGFRNVVNTVVNAIVGYFEFMVNAWIKAINLVIKGINLVKPGKDIGSLSEVKLGRIGEGGGSSVADFRKFEMANPGPTIASAPEMTAGSKGVNITVNTGVGDPVAIGRSVASVMDAYGRRAS
jgi:prepilin signal peptidase PulO-like enzyme (type II secretory pathway)